ncbi:MAG: penicillin-binding protein activator LpoB [Sphaerochaetaceae bacterium]
MRAKTGFLVVMVAVALLLFSCSSTINVKRLKAGQEMDLSGSWNDTDIRLVTDALIKSSLKADWITSFRLHSGRNPVIVVGTIRNRSSEHMDTEIIAKRFEMALVNTQKVDMVADIGARDQVRLEREEQQYYASEASSVALGKEVGADFLLQGAVRTVVDQIAGKTNRTYYVSAELIDIETSRKVWVGEETVKKLITQPRYMF